MNIRIYDPSLCCSTGVCGTNVDPALTKFAADFEWVKSKGIDIQRFNLGMEPMEFVANPKVQHFLEKSGVDSLPLILVDDEFVMAGRYPTRKEMATWLQLKLEDTPASTECCGGKKDCC